MISTSCARSLHTAVQHTTNTQVDLLVEGVKKMAEAAIVGDLYDLKTNPSQFRPPMFGAISNVTPTYDHWDMPTMAQANPNPPLQVDSFLASRYPRSLRPDLNQSSLGNQPDLVASDFLPPGNTPRVIFWGV